MRTVLKILLAAFLVIPNAVAAGLLMHGGEQAEQARLLQSTVLSGYRPNGPFLAQGELSSPSGAKLVSPFQRWECLAYRTEVDQLRERYSEDSDGNEQTRTERDTVFSERKSVPDLTVTFVEGAALLDLAAVEEFHATVREDLDEPPAFVPRERVSGRLDDWYVVSEDLFSTGQSVFVAASQGVDGRLGPHPVLGKLLLYPGTREQCAAALKGSSRAFRIAAALTSVVSLLICTVLALALRRANRVAESTRGESP